MYGFHCMTVRIGAGAIARRRLNSEKHTSSRRLATQASFSAVLSAHEFFETFSVHGAQ